MDNQAVISLANDVLEDLLDSYHEKYQLGSIVNSVYDTAWVSMVSKTSKVSSQPEWLFPECFEFLLSQQSASGGWGNPSSTVEQITCTLVSILAIKTHLRNSLDLNTERISELHSRVDKGVGFVRSLLKSWEPDCTDASMPIAFELWFPVVVEKLENADVMLDIPAKEQMAELRRQKLARFPVETLYQKGLFQPSPLFTLEGLIDVVDFSRLKGQKTLGSMFTSPASTAAYLMHCSEWDSEAEGYLRHTVERSVIKHNRSVPVIFPSTNFEIGWVCVV
jgi:hypothetical protein